MRRASISICCFVVIAQAGEGRAQHDHSSHDHHGSEGGDSSSFAGALGMIAASYDTMLYTGDYQGLSATARWSNARFGVAAGVTEYRLEKNGKAIYGLGDAMLHGQARLFAAGVVKIGALLAVSLPTGAHEAGLGMGHAMMMPGAFSSWSPGRLAFAASVGYGRALGDGSLHAEHGGVWPLVDPMNVSEVTFGASGAVSLARELSVGGRFGGAIPIGNGDARMAGGVRITWTTGRVETTAELQVGLVGDPFVLRGIVETSVRFN